MGLLMVEALLALEGCRCFSLGVQTPVWDIVLAAQAQDIDLVVLSFSPVLLPVPLVCASALLAIWWVSTRPAVVAAGYGWLVFANTVLVFVLAFFGLAYRILPDIVIGQLTVWEAAAATESLTVIFIGTAITLPVIIGYTVFMYRVFWGKARSLSYG